MKIEKQATTNILYEYFKGTQSHIDSKKLKKFI